jgi:hypothetical protein
LGLRFRDTCCREMELDKSSVANQRIRNAAQQAAAPDHLSVPVLERFLRTGDETWDGAGSGRFTPAQFENNTAYRRAAKEALRTLFHRLADLLPAEAKQAPQVAPELIRGQVEPMVKGLVEKDWQEVALRELVSRTFVLNYRGASRLSCRPVTCTQRGGSSGVFMETMASNQRMSR